MAGPKGNIHLYSAHQASLIKPRTGRLHIFWPLDDPGLPLPDGWTIQRLLQDDGSILQKVATEDYPASIKSPEFYSQARFLRVPTGPHLPIERTIAAAQSSLHMDSLSGASAGTPRWASFKAALEDLDTDDSQDPETGPEPDNPPVATVVHMTVATGTEPSNEDVSDAVLEGLEIVHATVRGLHASVGCEAPLPSPESAPFGVLSALELVRDESALHPKWGLGFFSMNQHAISAPEPLTPQQLSRTEQAVLHAATFDPLMLVSDLQRQAATAAHRVGDTRTAVVMAATACEVFIDLTIAALMWNEGSTPEAAAECLNQPRSTKEKLDTYAAPRLRGAWDFKRVPALREWRDRVARPRNRVVHGGGLPSSWRAQEAVQGMYGLTSLILDRLVSDPVRKRYAMASLLIAQRAGLEARGKWTRDMRNTADEADEYGMRGVFARWYTAMTELRLAQSERQVPQPADNYIGLCLPESGPPYWVERNEPARVARLAEPQVDDRPWVDAMTDHRASKPGFFISFDNPPRYISVGPWVPEHQLVPGIALSYLRDHWYKPRDSYQNRN